VNSPLTLSKAPPNGKANQSQERRKSGNPYHLISGPLDVRYFFKYHGVSDTPEKTWNLYLTWCSQQAGNPQLLKHFTAAWQTACRVQQSEKLGRREPGQQTKRGSRS
jgi:hypothetical protein